MNKKVIKLTESELKEIIKEELGISFELSKISENIYINIINDLKNRERVNNGSCVIKSGSVDCNMLDMDFKVSYTYRNFFDSNIVNTIGEGNLTDGYSYKSLSWKPHRLRWRGIVINPFLVKHLFY